MRRGFSRFKVSFLNNHYILFRGLISIHNLTNKVLIPLYFLMLGRECLDFPIAIFLAIKSQNLTSEVMNKELTNFHLMDVVSLYQLNNCNRKTMKKIFSLLLTVLFFIGFLSSNLTAQKVTDKYRVVAHKKGNNEIVSISNEVSVKRSPLIYVPTAFTPNGDGLNDTFGAVGEGIAEYTMEIFNRWGSLIFQSYDSKTQWDGTFKGELVPIGTYIYKIAATGSNERRVEKNGTVNVVL